MSTFQKFEELHAWKESRELARKIRALCKREAVKRDFTFIDQITRATRSISANIAEGNDSLTNPDFIKFLGYAKRSAAEVRAHLYDALDENYISPSEFQELSAHTLSIGNMIAKLIHYLQRLSPHFQRTSNSKNQ